MPEQHDAVAHGVPWNSSWVNPCWFGAPILIDEDARVFVSLGKTMAGLAAAEFQHEHYHRFLNLGRLNLQKSLITARQVAKSDFTDAQQRIPIKHLASKLISNEKWYSSKDLYLRI